jgi:hypothetical protein
VFGNFPIINLSTTAEIILLIIALSLVGVQRVPVVAGARLRMATLEEAITLDIARKWGAGIPARQIARDILAMNEIAEGLRLRDEKLKEQAGRGL